MIRTLFSGFSYVFLVSWFLLWPEKGFCEVPECPPGKQVLWYFPEDKLDENTHKGFTKELFSELAVPLSAIGYWLAPFPEHDTLVRSPVYSKCLLMHLYVRDASDDHSEENGIGEKEIFIALATTKEWNSSHGDADSVFRTLFSLRYSPRDLSTIQTIFVKKVLENLRTQYICTIAFATDPKGVAVTAQNGLSDHSPFEWVLPVGTLNVKCSMKKYLPLEKELVFSNPGQYNYFLQLRKRQFYHSNFIYPAAVAAIGSGIALGYKYFYYNRYSSLDSTAMVNTPQAFGQTFHKVQTCERVSLASILLSGSFLVLSFRF